MGVWTPGPGPTNGDDVFVGDATNETANGLNGNDTLTGNGGADTLDGGEGDDLVEGGDGDDVLWGEFNDGPDFEHQSDIVRGGDGNDIIFGGGGEDVLEGGAGNDVIVGGSGGVYSGGVYADLQYDFADYIDGGDGMDAIRTRYNVGDFGSTVTFDASAGSATPANLLVDGVVIGSIVNVEIYDYFYLSTDGSTVTVTMTDGADHVSVNGSNVTLYGGDGNDDLTAYGFTTFVDAGDGDDTIGHSDQGGPQVEHEILGGDGDDIVSASHWNASDVLIDGGVGDDILQLGFFNTGASGATFTLLAPNMTSSPLYSGAATGLSITGFERLHANGTDLNDSITGGANADILDGRHGDDIVSGAGGNDIISGFLDANTLSGGDGYDVLDYSWAGPNFFDGIGGLGPLLLDIDLARLSDQTIGRVNGVAIVVDQVSGFEQINGGISADLISGDDNDNVLIGGAGDDVLEGRGGNDTLDGGPGADVLDGGDGTDIVTYANSSAAVNVSVLGGFGTGGDAQGDTYISIENIRGSAFADQILGNLNANSIWGGAGNDELNGSSGADLLYGEAGDDTIIVGSGDQMFGGDGADTFEMPVLGSGGASGVLDGGDGDDTWSFANDSATAFLATGVYFGAGAGTLTLSSIENLRGGLSIDELHGDDNANRIWGGGSNDRLEGHGGADVLEGEAGSDVLLGGDGVDELLGGDNNDTLFGDAGADILNGGDGVDFAGFSGGVNINLATGVVRAATRRATR